MTDYLLLLIFTAGYAAFRGGAPERWAATIMVVGSVLSAVVQSAGENTFRGVEWGIFTIDLVDQILLTTIALLANRHWPLAAAGIHLIAVMAHIAAWILPAIQPGIYARAEVLGSRAILALIVLGTYRHRRRRSSLGSDPSWAPSSTLRACKTAPL